MGKLIIGLVMIFCGLALGVYVGVWLCFIGGIVQIIGEVRAPELEAMSVAIGVVKIVFAGFAGSLSGIFLVAPGAVILQGR